VGTDADKSRPLRRLSASTNDAVLAQSIRVITDAERADLEQARGQLTQLEGATPGNRLPFLFRRRPGIRVKDDSSWTFGDGTGVAIFLPGARVALPDPQEREKAELRGRIRDLEAKTGRANQVIRELEQGTP